MNNAEKFKQIFGLYATELWSMPEGDFLAWLNRDVETTQIDNTADIGKKVCVDTISRQAALDTIMGQPPEPHYPAWYAAQIEKLPAAQPDHTADIGKKVDVDDCISRQAAIDALHMHLMYRMGTDSNKKRLDDWINGVPSVQPEPLTDKEQRIFLAAMGREEKVCKQVDDDEYRSCREPYEDSLVKTCREIIRKVKGTLWT